MKHIKLFYALGSRSIFGTLVAKAASCAKISVIIGSHAALFSATNMVTPLFGVWYGMNASIVICALSIALRCALTGWYGLHLLAYHIPGLFAAWYWQSNQSMVRVGVPLLCMILFVVHPTGFYAAPYTLYWLIPVALYARKAQSVFATSLGSTFVAHAVGSVIWLYTVPMPTTMWLGLIPLVAVERLAFASGMSILYLCVHTVHRTLNTWSKQNRLLYKKIV